MILVGSIDQSQKRARLRVARVNLPGIARGRAVSALSRYHEESVAPAALARAPGCPSIKPARFSSVDLKPAS
jgi:hypothetical protein